MKYRPWLCATMTVLVLAVCGGCATVEVAGKNEKATGYVLKPHLGLGYKVMLSQDVETAFRATQRAFRELEVEAAEAKSDKLTGVVSGTLADGRKLEVQLSAQSPTGTELRLFVGTFADRDKSVVIFETIKKYF